MKAKNPTFLVLIIIISIQGFSQNWTSDWTAALSQDGNYTWTGILNVDFENNIYTTTPYKDILYLKDTILTSDNLNGFQNWAVIKQDDQGNILSVFDIAAAPDKLIYEVLLTTDKDLNMYIACEFSESVTLLGTTIENGILSNEWSTDVLIAKVNCDLELEWTRVVNSSFKNECHSIIFDDDHLYLTINHNKTDTSTDTIDFFGHDMTLFSYPMCSILKMNVDGNIKWRGELLGSGEVVEINGLIMKNPDNFLIHGYTYGELYYTENIIFLPGPLIPTYRPFIMNINSSGDFISGTILDWCTIFSGVEVDYNENIYFTFPVLDSIHFGNDTIIRHPDSVLNVIAKIDSNLQPLWHETVVTSSEHYIHPLINLCNDTLMIAVASNFTTELFDTIFETDTYKQTIVGQVSPDGVLLNHVTLNSDKGLYPKGLYIDNCNNLMVSGNYRGVAVIGSDTLQSMDSDGWDGLTVKINRNLQQPYNLGNDTTVCDNIVLSAPEGYQYYQWNDSLTQSNSYLVTEPGEYKLAFANDDGCWTRDAINIEIDPAFSINIGQDTAISPNDTLFLAVPDIYDSYLWWNGSTENATYITGEETGSGTWIVWVDIMRGACIVSDSIEVVVNSINQLKDIGVTVYPNPVRDVLNIISEERYDKIELLDLNGRVLISQDHYNQKTDICMSDLPKGIYLIRIYMDDLVGYGKVLKR